MNKGRRGETCFRRANYCSLVLMLCEPVATLVSELAHLSYR